MERLPGMPSSKIFQAYLERYALLSLEKQDKLESLIGEHLHELDLDAGTVRFEALQFPVQVVGTESYNTLTWLWAWADEQSEIPANLIQSAIQLRIWGAEAGIPELTMSSVDLNRADGHAVAMVASEVCKASCYYRDGYEGGAVFLLIFDRTIDNQPSFDRRRLLIRLADLLSRYDLNHRNAVLSYLVAKGLSPVEQRNMINCELESGERLIAEFDDAGRLTVVNGAAFEI
jgi:hypothetical protein